MTIMGVLPHRKLMELKNSGVVERNIYNDIKEEIFNINKERGFVGKSLYRKFVDFFVEPTSTDMLHYKLFSMCISSYSIDEIKTTPGIYLTDEEIKELKFVDYAAKCSYHSDKVLRAFKNFDDVYVDNNTARSVNWLLYNKYQLQDIVQEYKKRGDY